MMTNDDIELEYCCFGHAGDQNLHLNVLCHIKSNDSLESEKNNQNFEDKQVRIDVSLYMMHIHLY
jgi:hypothetical protein